MMESANTSSSSRPHTKKAAHSNTFQLTHVTFGVTMMAALLFAASFGADIDAKMHIQGQGLGKVLDVGSHYCIVGYHIFGFARYFTDPLSPTLVKAGLVFSFAFNLLATVFHEKLDGEYVPSPWFVNAFLVIGSLVLMCYTVSLAPVVGMEDGSINFTLTQLAILLATAVGDFIITKGGSHVLTKFGLNGYVFSLVGVAILPVLRAAYKKTGLLQIELSKYLFPAMAFSVIVEGAVEKYLHLDSHVFVHIFSIMFVALMNDALYSLNKSSASQLRVQVA